MADLISISIDSNAAEIVRQLEAFPDRMGHAIAGAMDFENELTVGHIQARKLSRRGPKTLGVVSNRLRSSIRPTKAHVSGAVVASSIGSNVAYAGVHEFGFAGVVGVRGHTRRQRSRDVTTGRGRRAQVLASGIARVRPHRRQMNMPARAPISTSIDERARNYTTSISAAIVRAWEGSANG